MFAIPREKVYDTISLLEKGHSSRSVAKRVGIGRTTVDKIRKIRLPGNDGARAGRPPSLSVQEERCILRSITSGECGTAAAVCKEISEHRSKPLSAETVRNVLKKNGFKACHKVKKPTLGSRHSQLRLEFAQTYASWTVEDWKRVIWSDETKINFWCSDGLEWCWRKPGSRLKPHHRKDTLKHGGGHIMIWGCMTTHGPGSLHQITGNMTADYYCRILGRCLEPTRDYYDLTREGTTFQHDNDPKHTAGVTKAWIREQRLQVLKWPPQSPDLNPIEHLWNNLKRRLGDYEKRPTSAEELWCRIMIEWSKITKEECAKLVESMPRRIAAVLEEGGGHTKY